MRVIGGTLRGRKLHGFKGGRIRPTSDRMRESVFNILSGRLAGARVLDLFAGTGALGIEALSRGAESAFFIDRAKGSLDLIRRNLSGCGLEERSRVLQWDVLKNLNCLQSFPAVFSLVFLDPPYGAGAVAPALAKLHESGALRSAATVVAEHDRIEPLAPVGSEYSMSDQRRYGKSLVTFFEYMI